jgi:hypothetical protein
MEMPKAELCSFCYRERLAMMQRTPYSFYDEHWQSELKYVQAVCGVSGDTQLQLPPYHVPENPYDSCITETWYTTPDHMTCDQVALANKISSAALFMANQYRIRNCAQTTKIPAATRLCLPAPCNRVHVIAGQTREECFRIESNLTNRVAPGDVLRFNPWVGFECRNFNTSSQVYGNVICLGPPYGEYEGGATNNDTTTPRPHDGYTYDLVPPPENATVAEGTTTWCGKWHVAVEGDSCAAICVGNQIPIDLFLQVNSGLGTSIAECSGNLMTGYAYCVTPRYDWEHPAVSMTFTDGGYTITTIVENPTSTIIITSDVPTTTATTTTATSQPTPYHSYGCYSDTPASDALTGYRLLDWQNMTVPLCARTCLGLSFALFGVSGGTICRCGNALGAGSIPQLPGLCSTACPGDGETKCGGSGMLNLYGVAADPPSTVTPWGWKTYSYTRCVGTAAGGYLPLGKDHFDDGGSMTVEACASFCVAKGWPTFGLHNGIGCYCEVGLRAGTEERPATDCNLPCSGNAGQTCGGPDVWSVWDWAK